MTESDNNPRPYFEHPVYTHPAYGMSGELTNTNSFLILDRTDPSNIMYSIYHGFLQTQKRGSSDTRTACNIMA